MTLKQIICTPPMKSTTTIRVVNPCGAASGLTIFSTTSISPTSTAAAVVKKASHPIRSSGA